MEQIKYNGKIYNIYTRNGEYVTLQDIKTHEFLLSIKLPTNGTNTKENKLFQKSGNKTLNTSNFDKEEAGR